MMAEDKDFNIFPNSESSMYGRLRLTLRLRDIFSNGTIVWGRLPHPVILQEVNIFISSIPVSVK
jgi:hypothetical protein